MPMRYKPAAAVTAPLGIYIHIPFCKRKCDYCDFYSICDYTDKLMDKYLDALVIHLQDFFRHSRRKVDTVYIGGGTPSVFGGKRIEKLLRELGKLVDLMPNAEITVEANPESIDEKFLKRIHAAGVNRLSMGIQSADDRELAAIGRLHTFRQAVDAYHLCRKYIDNISVDLIYALEGQTMERWMDNLKAICDLEPDHISCYCLKVEEGTPLDRRGCVQPDDDLQADMYLESIRYLERRGYDQYEISNFARNGRISRHNSRYWDLSEYLGIGCAAHSYYGGRRFAFVSDIHAYIDGVCSGRPVVSEQDDLDYWNCSGEYVMLKLRTCAGIDPEVFEQRFEQSFAPYAKGLEKYVRSGHAVCENRCWKLTPEGMLVSNAILADLLDGILEQAE